MFRAGEHIVDTGIRQTEGMRASTEAECLTTKAHALRHTHSSIYDQSDTRHMQTLKESSKSVPELITTKEMRKSPDKSPECRPSLWMGFVDVARWEREVV